MKKIILALVTCSVLSMANNTTVDATMKLMQQGMTQIQNGFVFNSKQDIEQGILTVENSNAIFAHVNVADFVKTNKIAVTQNINKNMTRDLAALKKAVSEAKYSEATKQYAKVLHECVACHTLIRGW